MEKFSSHQHIKQKKGGQKGRKTTCLENVSNANRQGPSYEETCHAQMKIFFYPLKNNGSHGPFQEK